MSIWVDPVLWYKIEKFSHGGVLSNFSSPDKISFKIDGKEHVMNNRILKCLGVDTPPAHLSLFDRKVQFSVADLFRFEIEYSYRQRATGDRPQHNFRYVSHELFVDNNSTLEEVEYFMTIFLLTVELV